MSQGNAKSERTPAFNGGELNPMNVADGTQTPGTPIEVLLVDSEVQNFYLTQSWVLCEQLFTAAVKEEFQPIIKQMFSGDNKIIMELMEEIGAGIQRFFPTEEMEVKRPKVENSFSPPYQAFTMELHGLTPGIAFKIVHRIWNMLIEDHNTEVAPVIKRKRPDTEIHEDDHSHVPRKGKQIKQLKKTGKSVTRVPNNINELFSEDDSDDSTNSTISHKQKKTKASEELVDQIKEMDLDSTSPQPQMSKKALRNHRACLGKLAQAQATQFAKSLYDLSSMGGVKFTRKSHDVTLPIFKQKFMHLISNLKKNHRDGYELLCIDYNGNKAEYLTTERIITCINLHIELDTLSHITIESENRELRGDSKHLETVDKYFNFIFEICQESTRLLSSIETTALTLKRNIDEPISTLISKIEQLHTNNQSVSMDCRFSEKQMRKMFIEALNRSGKLGDQGRAIYLTQHLTSEIPWHTAVEWVYKADALPDSYCLSQMKGMISEDGKLKDLPTLPQKSRAQRQREKRSTNVHPGDSASQVSTSSTILSKDELFHQKHKKWSPSMANCTYCHGPHLNFHCPQHPKPDIANKNKKWIALQASIRAKKETAATTENK